MNYPFLTCGTLALAAAMTVIVSGTGLAQTSPSTSDPAPLEGQTTTAPDPTSQPLTQPLEVDQQQSDQFFSPAPRPQIVERNTSSSSGRENLIEPPPGSQTPAEVTPGQRLNLQFR